MATENLGTLGSTPTSLGDATVDNKNLGTLDIAPTSLGDATVTTENLGTLGSTPISLVASDFPSGIQGVIDSVSGGATLTAADPEDTYQFRTTGTSDINLSLNEISFGDDADLSLYQDSNRNGRLDISTDRLVQSSVASSNQDDAINVEAGAGTYFAQVERFAPGSSGSVTYNLDLSATPTNSVSNLLPAEVTVGEFDPSLGASFQEFFGSIDNNNTADVYSFGLNDGAAIGESVDITLSGLGSDADIRLIRDSNANQIVDAGEQIGISSNGGSANDSILGIDQAGSYYLQVYQFSGSTDYTLNVDYFA